VIGYLEEVRVLALAAEAFPSALRAIEYLGRHIGMWDGKSGEGPTLLDLLTAVPTEDEP